MSAEYALESARQIDKLMEGTSHSPWLSQHIRSALENDPVKHLAQLSKLGVEVSPAEREAIAALKPKNALSEAYSYLGEREHEDPLLNQLAEKFGLR